MRERKWERERESREGLDREVLVRPSSTYQILCQGLSDLQTCRLFRAPGGGNLSTVAVPRKALRCESSVTGRAYRDRICPL